MIKEIKTGLVLEDDSIALTFMQMVLKDSFSNISINTASSLAEAYKVLDEFTPDIALVDLNLPDGSGVELLDRLRAYTPECFSIVMTAHEDEEYLFSALRAGAQGYLLKDQKRDVLIESLRGVIEGNVALTPKIAHKIIEYFSNNQTLDASTKKAYKLLSKREVEVLGRIGQGLSANQVAAEMNISHHTVYSHIKKIYSKLEITSRAEATQMAVQLGLTD